MKTIRFALMLTVAALAVIGLSPAYAFHSGGVAECTGCHSMHAPASHPLLAKGDPSSTCLNCHEHAGDTGPSSYHISTAPVDMPNGIAPKQRTPGGDFGWVKKTYGYLLRGTATTDPGQSHGHNIVAVDFGYVADPDNTTAPGGTMTSTDLACTSCHDPHSSTRRLSDGTIVSPTKAQGTQYAPIMGAGSYGLVPPAGLAAGVYRILGGSTYTPFTGGTNFPGVPSAVTPATYNKSEAVNQVRTAYGYSATGGYTSWGQWCATCHGDMHTNSGYVHPVEQGLGATIAGNYNAYLKTGDLTGTTANSFNSLVPFAENTSDIATLAGHAQNNDSQLGGPTANDGVMCLSCHRAHASAWTFSLRWNGENEFLTLANTAGVSVYPSYDAVGNTPDGKTLLSQNQVFKGYSQAEMLAAYYDRPATKFAPYQRQLCNKCHIQD